MTVPGMDELTGNIDNVGPAARNARAHCTGTPHESLWLPAQPIEKGPAPLEMLRCAQNDT